MFYEKSLMNSEMLGNVWKLANDMSTENVEGSNLPKICNELDSWVGSDSVLPHRRLSLRASSNLIGGAAKMYKQGIHRLFSDINKLDENIIWRRKRGHFNSSGNASSNDSSESMASPDQMRREATMGIIDSSLSPIKRGRIESISIGNISPRFMSRSSSDSLTTGSRLNSDDKDGRNRCPNDNCNLEAENVDQYSSKTFSNSDLTPTVGQHSPEISDTIPKNVVPPKKSPSCQRIDKGVQTSPILITKGRPTASSCSEDGFDRALPFGYLLIHDSYNSRVPCKIIFTSINSDVKNLI